MNKEITVAVAGTGYVGLSIFYAAQVRFFLNEYGGENLEAFCKTEQVSYNKVVLGTLHT